MRTDSNGFDPADRQDEDGGFLGMALLAVAVGAGAALLLAPAEGAKTRKVVSRRLRGLRGGAEEALARVQHQFDRRESRRRRERRYSALLGLVIGAGLTALLVPESGPDIRRRLADKVKRGKQGVGAEAERVVQEPQPQPEPARAL